MKREIKFNGWHNILKKMFSAEEIGEDELTLAADGRGFVNVNSTSKLFSEYIKEMIPLQFTGMLDKNGKEIYEGDIISNGINTWEIGFRDGRFGAVHKIHTEYLNDFNHNYIERCCELIGNVYENPERLRGE